MRRARLFDGVDAAGQPYFAPDRPRIADPAERESIAGFLAGGTVIRRTTGRDLDRIEPHRGQAVPMSTHTDGEWIWNAGLRYYVEVHGIRPEPEFVEYIAARGYVAAQADEAAARAALTELSTRTRSAPGHQVNRPAPGHQANRPDRADG